jgi:hypothetical protein
MVVPFSTQENNGIASLWKWMGKKMRKIVNTPSETSIQRA